MVSFLAQLIVFIILILVCNTSLPDAYKPENKDDPTDD